jgi:5-methylcytosine-specific restriction endonuclease McrA
MRRLAKQSRDDAYKSQRDYQTIHEVKTQALKFIANDGENSLVLTNEIKETANTRYVAFGGFLYPLKDITVYVKLEAKDVIVSKKFKLSSSWNRVGLIVDAPKTEIITVTLRWTASVHLNFWGLNADALTLPEEILALNPNLSDLQKSHLVPETFYLPHDTAIIMEINEDISDRFHLLEGETISLKKCSYCGRLLPISKRYLGSLSFHRHTAKLTKHQNECRSCKKWRINNSLNPLRTTDQLHESSVITRERKIFLRDSEILQEIKERTGAGLKSQVWERFGRKCFYCGKPLKLEEVQLDHTRPLAYLWPIDEHATCLCAEHNNQKKEKFPVEFYSDEQLQELSKICNLPYEELRKKELNEVELQRILLNLPNFAQQWEARTFAATARKINELRPDISLYALLEKEAPDIYQELMERLKERPLSVGEEEV